MNIHIYIYIKDGTPILAVWIFTYIRTYIHEHKDGMPSCWLGSYHI